MARYPHPLWSSNKASWRRELGVERPSGESPEKGENVAAQDYWAIKFKECVGRRRGRPSTVGLQEPSGRSGTSAHLKTRSVRSGFLLIEKSAPQVRPSGPTGHSDSSPGQGNTGCVKGTFAFCSKDGRLRLGPCFRLADPQGRRGPASLLRGTWLKSSRKPWMETAWPPHFWLQWFHGCCGAGWWGSGRVGTRSPGSRETGKKKGHGVPLYPW